MSEKTKIQWCDHTWNPWIGCTKVSPGCANCYAEVSTPSRTKGIRWGKGQHRERTSAAYWCDPVRWNAKARKAREAAESAGQPWTRPRVFPSLCDWLDDEVPIEWLWDFMSLIQQTPELDWLLLSKRIEQCKQRLRQIWVGFHESKTPLASCLEEAAYMVRRWMTGHDVPFNIWLGASVEDQQRANERIWALLIIPASVRFLSCEPLLGPLSLDRIVITKSDAHERGKPDVSIKALTGWYGGAEICSSTRINWVIVGGESGPSARPCHVEWIESIVQQCLDAGVACFVKQFGAVVDIDDLDEPTGFKRTHEHDQDGRCYAELKHPKGGDPSEWPERLRVREFPERKKVNP